MTTQLRMLRLAELHPDPGNPREDEQPSAEMVESIRTMGILQALLVKSDGDGYMLIDGHRRWRGGTLAGTEQAPAVLVDGWSATQVLEAQIATGIHAKGLNPIEQAKALKRLQSATGTSQRATASIAGLSQAKVSQLLMLLRLAPHLQGRVARGECSVQTALGYNRSPSVRLTTRGGVDPAYDELKDAVRTLGMALLRDEEAVPAAASEVQRLLTRWLPEGLVDGEHRAPMIRCPYCREAIPVEHPAESAERARAQSSHLARSQTCRAKHQRAMRQATG